LVIWSSLGTEGGIEVVHLVKTTNYA
jgi:hypothetical protein